MGEIFWGTNSDKPTANSTDDQLNSKTVNKVQMTGCWDIKSHGHKGKDFSHYKNLKRP